MAATIEIYTDGSCSGNPGPGGWAAVLTTPSGQKQISGGETSTTNNRMELMAAIKGLESTPLASSVEIHSDSEYLVKTMTLGWKRRVNHDLWEQLDRLASERDVKWLWVKGHAGDPRNEQADQLAVAAMGRYSQSAAPSGAAPAAEEVGKVLSHLDSKGNAQMVDVGDKPDSVRVATAIGRITMHPETLGLILDGQMPKGDVFTVARLAGINAAKHTWDLIPLAHQIPLSVVAVDFETDRPNGVVIITSGTRTTAKTGVEMEALAAVAIAGLTIYDMCKAVDRSMTISEIRLLKKSGGTRPDYRADTSE